MDSYFFKIAEAVASKSKDPSRQVGAVIVDEQNRIVSTGYNGMIAGCTEHSLWVKPLKYGCVIHAEMNALMYAKRDLKNCVLYTTLAPCSNCLKHILQAGMRKVFYLSVHDKIVSDPDEVKIITTLINVTDAYVRNGQTRKFYLEELWEVDQTKP